MSTESATIFPSVTAGPMAESQAWSLTESVERLANVSEEILEKLILFLVGNIADRYNMSGRNEPISSWLCKPSSYISQFQGSLVHYEGSLLPALVALDFGHTRPWSVISDGITTYLHEKDMLAFDPELLHIEAVPIGDYLTICFRKNSD